MLVIDIRILDGSDSYAGFWLFDGTLQYAWELQFNYSLDFKKNTHYGNNVLFYICVHFNVE